jgi:predicted enzyme related to lactoylglutathione lyase
MTSFPDFVLLYSKDPLKSAEFYAALFGVRPMDTAPTFVLFDLPGFKLGLWSRSEIEPKAESEPGAAELCISRASDDEVLKLHADWVGLGVSIIQKPARHDFGLNFAAVDPDGHRIRVFAPGN